MYIATFFIPVVKIKNIDVIIYMLVILLVILIDLIVYMYCEVQNDQAKFSEITLFIKGFQLFLKCTLQSEQYLTSENKCFPVVIHAQVKIP